MRAPTRGGVGHDRDQVRWCGFGDHDDLEGRQVAQPEIHVRGVDGQTVDRVAGAVSPAASTSSAVSSGVGREPSRNNAT
jgi:hypothetical protein